MSSAAQTTTLDLILAPATLTYGLYGQLLDGVTPDRFARTINGVTANHPAYLLGHVAHYAGKFTQSLGASPVETISDSLEPIYAMGAECTDDAAGTVYPAMKDAVADFDRVMRSVLAALPTIDPDRLAAPLTEGAPFYGRMPTFGAVANFVLVAHPMMHAGQFSTWRRCMGLGPCKLM